MSERCKPIIMSPYMDNISKEVRDAQAQVFRAVANDLPFIQLHTTRSHADTLDSFTRAAFREGYNTVMLWDIDAIPLNPDTCRQLLQRAYITGCLAGNIQRSNHLQNDQHLFIAPSCCCFSRETYEAMGKPSFAPTSRGDVGEELTYQAEAKGIQVQAYVPLMYEALPAEGIPWQLNGDLRDFGIHTIFGEIATVQGHTVEKPMTFHTFQMRTSSHVDRFLQVCDKVKTLYA